MWRQENGKEALGILRQERRGSENTTSPQGCHETAIGCVLCALPTAFVHYGGDPLRPAGVFCESQTRETSHVVEKDKVSQREQAHPRPPLSAVPWTSPAVPGVPRESDGAVTAQQVAEVMPPCARGGRGEKGDCETMRCLIIEDNADTAHYIGGGLEEAGYRAV